MSAVTLPQGKHYIHFILPSIKIYYTLNTLLTDISTTNNNEQHFIVIGVEHNNRKRHFLSLTIDELSKLLYSLESPKRTLYEILCQNNFCKLYFDVDIYIDKSLLLNIQESLSILQDLFHYIISNCTNQLTYNSTSSAGHFLVLSASTELKHSYHLIYTNTNVRFGSQQIIFQFIIMILYHCSQFILSHLCHQQFLQSINIHAENNFNNCLKHLQTILTHTNFYSNGFYQWIFDLHVYNKNQQFRLYKATKFGQDNPLLTTSDFPFNGQNEQHDMFMNNVINYDTILNHALISYTINNTNLLIVSYNESKWSLTDQNKNHIIDITATNYFTSLIVPNKSTFETNRIQRTPTINTTEASNKQDHFKNVVLKLIKKIYHGNGYVLSCQQGTKNQSLFFYNIGGEFRYCEHLQRHHKSNRTCIIIDTFTYKYQIKCKDPDCRNFKPPWKDISQFIE
ncbi:unnamed protein product [Rotaria sordida]|uniref:DNA-directed primase/polymerase protein n=1 Tax=Rotaria sordida TaxID=392033 RepID=A0A819CGV8_9BILA|nr:unnamed protein product [Rotaria sordida]